MAGTHLISGSLLQSGSTAEFKNGMDVTDDLIVNGPITANNFNGVGVASNEDRSIIALPILNVGKDKGPSEYPRFEKWVTTINNTIRITASGNFHDFTFIENTNDDGKWKTVEKGDFNGRLPVSFYERSYNEPGIYEYIIIASNSESLQTVVKETTVTVTE
tara:strand:- start:1415 stop:1897 length:483 start_codon:yes stop_codon:yes gene_type:complete